MAFRVSGGADGASPGRAPGVREPGAQPGAISPRHREEGEEGSRGTLGPDGSPATETSVAEQLCFAESSDGYITFRPPSKTNAGGEDWLEVSLYLVHRDLARLSVVLDRARKAAEEGRQGDDEVEFQGQRFLVRPGGAGAGSKGKRIYYRWQLLSETGLLLQLMNRARAHKTMPNGSLRATSLLLMQNGGQSVWRQGKKIISALDCRLRANKLSRVDACVDLSGAALTAFSDSFSDGHYVSRARASREYFSEESFALSDQTMHSLGREPTGFEVGRDGLRLRVYDKLRECSHSVEKLRVLADCRWGEYPHAATRVEYQIRREKLKYFGVDTVEDWFDLRAAICEYLTTNWFRLTDGPIDRQHADRSPTLAAWLDVHEKFAEWAGKSDYAEFRPVRTQAVFPDQLLRQIAGLFVSYFARSGTAIDSNETFGHEAMCALLDEIAERDMSADVRRRALELGLSMLTFKEADDVEHGES